MRGRAQHHAQRHEQNDVRNAGEIENTVGDEGQHQQAADQPENKYRWHLRLSISSPRSQCKRSNAAATKYLVLFADAPVQRKHSHMRQSS